MRKSLLIAGVASLAVLAAACGKAGSAAANHPSAAARASSAAVHIKALATNPTVQAQVKKVAPKIQSCAAQNGITLTIVGAGTSKMSAKVTHVGGLVMLHPIHSIESIFTCAGLTSADVAKVKSYAKAQILANGFGTGSGTKDFTHIVIYASGLMTGKAS
jgi:uncharacterized phosphosugar-binding protein